MKWGRELMIWEVTITHEIRQEETALGVASWCQ